MTMELADEAVAAVELAGSDPIRAAAAGYAIINRARAVHDHVAWSIAERACGLAAYHSTDVDIAITHLRQAVFHARRCGSARLAGLARMTLAFVYASRGRLRPSLLEIDTALRDLRGLDRARAEVQRAGILAQFGRLDEALAGYTANLPALRAADDWLWVWRALSNRAVVHGRLQRLAAAAADLRDAAALCDRY
jgi:tetratricopeptide (TPR) repeat protein